MKKRILSLLAAGTVLAGSLCGASVAGETAVLSPRASVEIIDGKICGVTGLVKTDWLKSQFAGEAEIKDRNGKVLADEAVVPSDSTVSVNGNEVALLPVYGDADFNGKINVGDVTAMLKCIAKWDVTVSETGADSNRDGKINIGDVTLLLKYIAKWDVQLFDSPAVLSVFENGVTDYKLYAEDDSVRRLITEKIKALTGHDMETVSEVLPEDKLIIVGKNLQNTYDFIDGDAVAALEDIHGYIDTYGGDVYLTANSYTGIDGCINYITNQGFTPGLDLSIEKGMAGVLGDKETLLRPLFTEIEIEGLKNPHRLLHVTDTHLTTIYDNEENDERRANVASRLNDWMINMYKKPSYMYFGEYFNYADDINAERIILTGDITDSPSQSNRDILESEIDGAKVPTYYVYGNHDWSWNDNYHSEQYRKDYVSGFTASVDKYDEDWNEYYNIIDEGDFMILSVDNAWDGFGKIRRDYYMDIKKNLDAAKAEGKPVILMLHVPIHTDEMHEAIHNIDGNGYCMSYQPGQNLLYDLIMAEDTPVKAIFCGHVHANYETMVDGRIPQYLTGAGLEGYCRVVDLVPAK